MSNRGRCWLLVCAVLFLATAGAEAQAIFGPVKVGGSTPPAQQTVPVTVTALSGGAVNSAEVLTLGAPSLDFKVGTGPSCVSATHLAAGAQCNQSVLFSPQAPGVRVGAVVLLDTGGNVLGIAYISGIGSGGLGVLIPGNVLPVAGDGLYEGPVNDGYSALNGELNHPSGVALDGAGNLYIADRYHNRIRMVCASAASATIKGTAVDCTGPGVITTIVGNGAPTDTGDGKLATDPSVTINTPWSLALDGAGNLYIADTGNNAVRKVTAATGIISTVAGTGTAGDTCEIGPPAAAASCEINQPQGVSVDAAGNLYIADTYNHRIRRVDASGTIATVAGNGYTNPSGNGAGGYLPTDDGGPAGNAELNYPFAVAFDAAGNMYIPDSANNLVRKVAAVNHVLASSDTITTFAGTPPPAAPGDTGDGSAATSATLFSPSGVAVDPAGNVYIADTQNSAIRKVNAATGAISTIAQSGIGTYVLGGAGPYPVNIYGPVGLYLDGSGNLYFADVLNMRVREIQSNFVALNFAPGTPPATVRQGDKSAPQSENVENDGNASLDITAIAPDQNAAIDAGSTTCTTGSPFLAIDDDCAIGAEFAPSPLVTPIDGETGNIFVGQTGDTPSAPLDIELIGDATLVNSTTTTVTSAPGPDHSDFGQSVTFTATVTTGVSAGNLTGTVSFFDGATTLEANVPLNARATTATAAFTTVTPLTVGVHNITATYNAGTADPNHFTSTSPIFQQTVQEPTVTTLTSSSPQNTSSLGANVTFTATVAIGPAGGGVPPDGNVTFTDGSTTLGTVALNASGVATFTTTTPLPQGQNQITANYLGDSTKQIEASSSAALDQDVLGSTGITLGSSLNPSAYGSSVTFTATVTAGGNVAPTGSVNFFDGILLIGSALLPGSNGQVMFSTSTLTAGTHSITAAYQGDPNNAAATSLVVSQIVNKTTPTLTWATPAAIAYGTALSGTQLDATAGTVAGTFTYSPTFGVVLAAGTQTLSVTFTPADPADYNTPLAVTVQLTVNKATPALALTTSGTPSSYGSPVTFTATLSSGPTGVVTFSDANAAIGTGAILGVSATFTASTLTVGSHTITASWPGNSNFNSITSTILTQVVSIASAAITWPAPASIPYGTALSSTQLDATTSIPGTFTYSPAIGTLLSAGQHTLSVTFTPTDTTDYSTTKASVTLTVNQAVPLIAWTAPQPITYGAALGATQLNASATGVGGSPLPGNFVYTPPSGTILAAGVQTLSVTFTPTDTVDYTSPTATVQLNVNKATPTLTVASSGTPSTYGSAVTFTATISSGPTGAVTFYDGPASIGVGTLTGTTASVTTSALTVGSHSITATWPGNNNYISATTGVTTQVVNQTQTTTSLAGNPNPGIAGLPVALTATVKIVAGAATLTGNVTFTDGTVTLGSANLNAAGTATLSPMLAPGQHSIVATYSGDANDAGSLSSALSLSVVLATTQTVVSTSASTVLVQTPIVFTAKVSGNGATPTGPVTFLSDGAAMAPAVNVDATGTATITYAGLTAGTHQITAAYAGDKNDSSSTSAAISQIVGTIPTVTDLGVSSTTGATPAVILVAAVLNNGGSATPVPTGTVTYKNGSTVLGSATLDSSGVATFTPNLALGTYSIVAAYGGDADHTASTSTAVTVSGTVTGFNLTASPAAVTIVTSQNATLQVSLVSEAGFTDTIGLGCGSVPSGVNCHFTPSSVALSANGVATAQLVIDTGSPLTGGSSAMNSHSGGLSLAGLFLPVGVLFGFLFRRFRLRHAGVFATVLLFLLSSAAMLVTGCGGIATSSVAPGTYVLQVIGTGQNSNVIHYQNVTLTITK